MRGGYALQVGQESVGGYFHGGNIYSRSVVETMPTAGTWREMREALVGNYRKRTGRKAEAMLLRVVSRGGIRAGDASKARARVCRKHLAWDPSGPGNGTDPHPARGGNPLCSSPEANPLVSSSLPSFQSRGGWFTQSMPLRDSARTYVASQGFHPVCRHLSMRLHQRNVVREGVAWAGGHKEGGAPETGGVLRVGCTRSSVFAA